ncbi:MAG: hypothetical protein JNM94_17965 [Phycisphaerae bacterium]|nr:hypothetical protein [Phycisphaerae bacterium]
MRCLRSLAVLACCLPTASFAGIAEFVSSPTNNSSLMAAWAASLGPYAIDGSVDFETHPNGELIADFYPGVTLAGENVVVDHGPGSRSGTDAPPLSDGEGPLGPFQGYTANGAVRDGWSLTVSFDVPVVAAGFMTADIFNGFGDNGPTVEAFDGPDGTGTLLAAYPGAAFNFEVNNRYFMGIGDAAGRIKSIRISLATVLYGDSQYVDGVLFASAAPAQCPADLNGDGVVDGADLAQLLGGWGSSGAADLDGDGVINGADLAQLLGAWGNC